MTAIAGPVRPGQRIQIIDIWRGFAIFGILLVNMELFNQAIQGVSLGLEVDSGIDQITRWFIAFFGEGKF